MSSIGNNMSRKAAELRDTFFASYDEQTRAELLSQPIDRDFAKHLENSRGEDLCKEAEEFMANVELGKYSEDEMYQIEVLIAHLLAAIIDIQRTKEMEKTPDFQHDEEMQM